MMFQAVASPMYITVNTAMFVVAGSGAIRGRATARTASSSRPASFRGPPPHPPPRGGGGGGRPPPETGGGVSPTYARRARRPTSPAGGRDREHPRQLEKPTF